MNEGPAFIAGLFIGVIAVFLLAVFRIGPDFRDTSIRNIVKSGKLCISDTVSYSAVSKCFKLVEIK